MSTTTAQTQTGAMLGAWLDQLTGMYCADLAVMPEEQLFTSIGGKVRTAQDFTCEVAMMMTWVAGLIHGNAPFAPGEAEQAKWMEGATTKDSLVELMKTSAAKLKESLATASQEQLDTVIETPFGMTMPAAAIANLFVNHIWYHDGQLNVIQAFHGDEKVHWM